MTPTSNKRLIIPIIIFILYTQIYYTSVLFVVEVVVVVDTLDLIDLSLLYNSVYLIVRYMTSPMMPNVKIILNISKYIVESLLYVAMFYFM